MTKTMMLASAVLASTMLAACGEKKAEDTPAATTEAPADMGSDAMAPAAEATTPPADEDGEGDERGNDVNKLTTDGEDDERGNDVNK